MCLMDYGRVLRINLCLAIAKLLQSYCKAIAKLLQSYCKAIAKLLHFIILYGDVKRQHLDILYGRQSIGSRAFY